MANRATKAILPFWESVRTATAEGLLLLIAHRSCHGLWQPVDCRGPA